MKTLILLASLMQMEMKHAVAVAPTPSPRNCSWSQRGNSSPVHQLCWCVHHILPLMPCPHHLAGAVGYHPPTTVPRRDVLVVVIGLMRGGPPAWYSLVKNVLEPLRADLAVQSASPIPMYLERQATFIWPTWQAPTLELRAEAVDLVLGHRRASVELMNDSLAHTSCFRTNPFRPNIKGTWDQYTMYELLARQMDAWQIASRYDQVCALDDCRDELSLAL